MNPKYDILIQGGHVIDPANNVDGLADVAVVGGKIAAVGQNLQASDAKMVMDAKGAYVTPGILDIHAHVYPPYPVPPHALPSIEPDVHLLRAGVTTAVDVGTTGWRDFPTFRESVIERAHVRVLAMINIASGGMVDMRTEQNPKEMQPKVVAELAKAYPDIVVGVKAAHYWGGWGGGHPFDAEHPAWASTDRTVEAAALAGIPAMIDFQPNLPESSYQDLILKHMRPGDIHTHVFARQFPTVNKHGKVLEHMWKARERGVLFDVGHGGGSFWFRNAKPALDDGFPPDTISTDIHYSSILYAGIDNLQMMSKFLCMGMGLTEVVARSTNIAAQAIRRPELGNLSVGGCADIAILKLHQGQFTYVDCGKAKLTGTQRLECLSTIRAGEVLYNAGGLGIPEWDKAPAEYWEPVLEEHK